MDYMREKTWTTCTVRWEIVNTVNKIYFLFINNGTSCSLLYNLPSAPLRFYKGPQEVIIRFTNFQSVFAHSEVCIHFIYHPSRGMV